MDEMLKVGKKIRETLKLLGVTNSMQCTASLPGSHGALACICTPWDSEEQNQAQLSKDVGSWSERPGASREEARGTHASHHRHVY